MFYIKGLSAHTHTHTHTHTHRKTFKKAGIQAYRNLNDSVPSSYYFGVLKSHSAYLCGPGRVVGGLKNNYRGLLVVGEVGGRER